MLIVSPWIAILALSAQPAAPQPAAVPGAEPGTGATRPVAADVAAGGFNSSDELLEALETADETLRTLRAEVIWTKVFDLAGDRHVRRGTLYFADFRKSESGGGKGRAFAALFDSLLIGELRSDEKKHYVFDGEYIAEKVPADRKITRSRIASDGKDPLKIGEGPMPIPIGQRRADILARYEVRLLPAEQDLKGDDESETAALRTHVADAAQLRLLPRPGAGSSDFREIRLWYRRGSDAKGDPQLLPRMARTVNNVGDVEIVQLIGVKTNSPVDRGMFETVVPDGWTSVDR